MKEHKTKLISPLIIVSFFGLILSGYLAGEILIRFAEAPNALTAATNYLFTFKYDIIVFNIYERSPIAGLVLLAKYLMFLVLLIGIIESTFNILNNMYKNRYQ